MDQELANALFNPAAIALVGASADATKSSARPQQFLRKHGYQGRIVPINPNRQEIFGETCYPDLMAAPDGIEHAYLMCPPTDVLDVIRQCAKRRIHCATILAGGFGDAGPEGQAREAAIVHAAGTGGVRLLGPNSIGVINTRGFAASASAILAADRLLPGRLAVISQSGSLIGALISQGLARNIGFSKLISVGNESDLGIGEIGELLLADDDTEAILLFLESIRSREGLRHLAAKAFTAGKPILAYKLGRSEAGRRIALSHTGAIAGSDEIVDLLLADLGIARLRVFDALIEAAPLFIDRKPPQGRRVAVVTTTGGGAAMVVDNLGAAGIDLARIPPSVDTRLAQLGISRRDSDIVDLTMAGARADVVHDVIGALVQSPDCDAIVMVVGSSAEFHPQLAVEPLVGLAGQAKPLAIYVVPHAEASRARLAAGGLATFRTPEACADAIRAYLDWRPPRLSPPVPPREEMGQVAAMVATVQGVVGEVDGYRIFRTLGVPVAAHRVMRVNGEADRIFGELGAPLVVKVLAADISHKSDCGGVVLGIESAAALSAAADLIRHRVGKAMPGLRVEEFLVQRMEKGVGEVLVGYRRDQALGPVVTVGPGGLLAELLRDHAMRLAPVSLDEAMQMIASVGMLAPVRGYRGSVKGDVQALARAVVAVSWLSEFAAIKEAEINPLIVKAEGAGVVAVDALVVC